MIPCRDGAHFQGLHRILERCVHRLGTESLLPGGSSRHFVHQTGYTLPLVGRAHTSAILGGWFALESNSFDKFSKFVSGQKDYLEFDIWEV